MLNRMKVPSFALLALLLIPLTTAACRSGTGVAGASGPRPDVEALLASSEYDEALARLDAYLETHPDDAASWRAKARALELLVNEGGGSFLAIQDAADAWDRALALEPRDVATLQGAAATRFELGEYDRASELSARALVAALDGGTPSSELLSLHLRSRIGVFQRLEETDDAAWSAELGDVLEAVRAARDLAPQDGDLAVIEAGFLDWLGVPDVAVERMRSDIPRIPGDVALHKLFIDIHVREGIDERLPRLYAGWKANTDEPTVVWYTGYVARLAGDLFQRERDFGRAREAYARCIEEMDEAAREEESYRPSAQAIANQARVSTIWCDMEEQRFAEAEAGVLELLDRSPERRDEPDGLGRSLMNAIAGLGQHLVDLSQYERAARVARAVVAVVPDDGEWWNNLGFLLREYGSQMQNGAFPDADRPEERAKSIFRESWRAYQHAAELKPDDARVINDGALIQVYHLHEELGVAEEMLHRAIEVGEAQLAAMGPDADESERFPVAQAVGDAYQNLGYLYYQVLGKKAESREYWVKSMESDSGDRSMFQAYLDDIDGKGEPVPDRENGFVQPPEERLPDHADIAWEAPFDTAREIARDEGRPLVVYDRGQALGLSIPFLDRFAAGPRFAERTRGAVVAVADPARHTFVDRRRDGTRLPCPKWGALTCAEHVQTARQFDAWYLDEHGSEPGESEEGLWIQRQGASTLERLEGGGFFQEEGGGLPETAEAASGAKDIAAIEAGLAGDDPVAAARELVAMHRRASRDAIESVLFDDDSSPEGVHALVGALAEDDDPASKELLGVLVWQPRERLAMEALRAWPEGRELGPVVFASRWSRSEAVRAAARELLGREQEGYARVEIARRLAVRAR